MMYTFSASFNDTKLMIVIDKQCKTNEFISFNQETSAPLVVGKRPGQIRDFQQ